MREERRHRLCRPLHRSAGPAAPTGPSARPAPRWAARCGSCKSCAAGSISCRRAACACGGGGDGGVQVNRSTEPLRTSLCLPPAAPPTSQPTQRSPRLCSRLLPSPSQLPRQRPPEAKGNAQTSTCQMFKTSLHPPAAWHLALCLRHVAGRPGPQGEVGWWGWRTLGVTLGTPARGPAWGLPVSSSLYPVLQQEVARGGSVGRGAADQG